MVSVTLQWRNPLSREAFPLSYSLTSSEWGGQMLWKWHCQIQVPKLKVLWHWLAPCLWIHPFMSLFFVTRNYSNMQPQIPVKDQASEALSPMVSSTVRIQKMAMKRCTLQVIRSRKAHSAMHRGGELSGCPAAPSSWHSCTPYATLDGQEPFDDWSNPGHGTLRCHTQQLGTSGRWRRSDYSPMQSQPLH